MNLILTERCCGKSHSCKYPDFDIFAKAGPNSKDIIHNVIALYSATTDDTYLFNVTDYYRYECDTIPTLHVVRVVLPHPSSYEWRKGLYIARGNTRNNIEHLIEKYENAWKRFPQAQPLYRGQFIDNVL